MAAADKCLERLGTDLATLQRNPALFSSRLGPTDRAQTAQLRAVAELRVSMFDERSGQSFPEVIRLGSFVEYQTNVVQAGLVVGLLAPVQQQQQQQHGAISSLALVVPLPMDSDETARLPGPDSYPELIKTSWIKTRIDVEEQAPAKLTLQGTAGFLLCVGKSLYGMDEDGSHVLCAHRMEVASIARARRGEVFATTFDGHLLSVDAEKARFKEIATLADVRGTKFLENEFSTTKQKLYVIGLSFAEGRPAMPLASESSSRLRSKSTTTSGTVGACQLFGIGKNVRGLDGCDCVVAISPTTGKVEVFMELGRRDVVALAVVPVSLGALQGPNAWSQVGNSDARLTRFIIWTEMGGLFLVDEKRKMLQQLGGELVTSLQVRALCFDEDGELYAAGQNYLYHVSAAGRVSEVASLFNFPGRVDSMCAAPKSLTQPAMTSNKTGGWFSSPSKKLSTTSLVGTPGGGDMDSNGTKFDSLLRLLRLKRPVQSDRLSAPRGPAAGSGGSFSGRRSSAAALPVEGASAGEMNRRGSGTLTKSDLPFVRPVPASTTSMISMSDGTSSRYNNNSPDRAAAAAADRGGAIISITSSSEQQPQRRGGPYFPQPSTTTTTTMPYEIRPPPGPPPPPSGPPPPDTARNIVSVGNKANGDDVSATSNGQYKDVPAMLVALGLPQYVAIFRQEEMVDLDLLTKLWTSERDFKELLREIGVVKLGHREMIALAVKEML